MSYKQTVVFLPVLFFALSCYGQEEQNYPIPAGVENLLFYVQRSVNTNTIIYALNVGKDGLPDTAQPIKIYWKRYANKGEERSLSFIQRKYAYGLKVKPGAVKGTWSFTFNAYKKKQFELRSSIAEGKYQVFAVLNNIPAMVTDIYVKVIGGTFMFPVIKYVHITGTRIDNNAAIVETIIP